MNATCTAAILIAVLALTSACGGGGGGGDASDCDGTCPPAALSALDIETVVAQAVGEAQALGLPATIAVVDRVGNVLAVFRTTGAPTSTVVTSRRGVSGGLENFVVPTEVAAISKAGTAAYLSSQGNAFTTRTASQIIQEHFNPGERGRPGGPLFGVQLSQLPCGDVVTSFSAADPNDRTGPHRMPLGFSADPGGIPLYMDVTGGGLDGRVPVGGVGVETGCAALDACTGCTAVAGACKLASDALVAECAAQLERVYTLDLSIEDVDTHLEERIAAAAAAGYEAPSDRRANRIFVEGKSLRFADDESAAAPTVTACADLAGAFVAVAGYTNVAQCADLRDGAMFGAAESGILATTFSGHAAEILVDRNAAPRFAPKAGSGLTAAEVSALLANALAVSEHTRAQIRRPLGTRARVSMSVVDPSGEILGIVRSVDAPVFGVDVSVQKARAAVFFSSPSARAALLSAGALVSDYAVAAADFLSSRAQFAGDAIAPEDVLTGTIAFSARAVGNLARPFFPDGINRNSNGPFSLPFEQWSPFTTGLQLDLVANAVVDASCVGTALSSCSDVASLPNGIQIFAGGVPVYRGSTLVGAVGVSGDGIDQDDLIAFLAVDEASTELGGTIHNAAADMRADRLSVDGAHVRYVNCPVKPFLDSNDQGACDGL